MGISKGPSSAPSTRPGMPGLSGFRGLLAGALALVGVGGAAGTAEAGESCQECISRETGSEFPMTTDQAKIACNVQCSTAAPAPSAQPGTHVPPVVKPSTQTKVTKPATVDAPQTGPEVNLETFLKHLEFLNTLKTMTEKRALAENENLIPDAKMREALKKHLDLVEAAKEKGRGELPDWLFLVLALVGLTSITAVAMGFKNGKGIKEVKDLQNQAGSVDLSDPKVLESLAEHTAGRIIDNPETLGALTDAVVEEAQK